MAQIDGYQPALGRSSGCEAQYVFVDTHPEYYPCSANAKKIATHLHKQGHTDFTVENLESAYSELKAELLPRPAAQKN